MSELAHVPVLFDEVIAALDVQSNRDYIDCTLGGGGHARGILERTGPAGRLLGLDRDPHAVSLARERLSEFTDRITLINHSFADVGAVAAECGFAQVDGMLFDLGLSSLQLADPARGFSFQSEGPLDMRFDTDQSLSADEIINHWSEREIADLIYRYGEEPRSRSIARAIVRQRPLRTTTELAEVVARTVRQRGRTHPATRTFQALRMAVNDELQLVEQALPQSIALLRPRGRLAVISFHSMEDRIVKNFMREQQQLGTLSIINKKPIISSQAEVRNNPRSRSAKLRVASRL